MQSSQHRGTPLFQAMPTLPLIETRRKAASIAVATLTLLATINLTASAAAAQTPDQDPDAGQDTTTTTTTTAETTDASRLSTSAENTAVPGDVEPARTNDTAINQVTEDDPDLDDPRLDDPVLDDPDLDDPDLDDPDLDDPGLDTTPDPDPDDTEPEPAGGPTAAERMVSNLLISPPEGITITGSILTDTDHNGTFEEGLTSLDVQLIDADGTLIATTTLDTATSQYEFRDVIAGEYTIRPDLEPLGLYPVTETDGTSDSRITVTTATDISGQNFFVAPQAMSPDTSTNNLFGTPVTIDVLANDHYAGTPTNLTLATGLSGPSTSLNVTNEGTWSISPDTFSVTFTPEAGFGGITTPITYTVDLANGIAANTSTVAVSYATPEATNSESLDNIPGRAVTISPLAGTGTQWDPASINVLDADDNPVATANTPAVGAWQANPSNGTITFTPDPNIDTSSTTSMSIRYELSTPGCSSDTYCHTTIKTATVTYMEALPTLEMTRRAPGSHGQADLEETYGADYHLDLNSVQLLDPTTGAGTTELNIEDEGVWKADTTGSGAVRFDSVAGTHADATPIGFTVAHNHNPNVRYYGTIEGRAAPTFTAPPSPPNLPDIVASLVVEFPAGEWAPGHLHLFDPESRSLVYRLVVPGEGEWTVYWFDEPTLYFHPEDGFTGDPTPVLIAIKSEDDGLHHYAYAIVRRTKTTEGTTSEDNIPGRTVTIDPLDHDNGTFDPTTVTLLDPSTKEPRTAVTTSDGAWTVDGTTGHVTFAPAASGLQYRQTGIYFRVEPADCSGSAGCEPAYALVTLHYQRELDPIEMLARGIDQPQDLEIPSRLHPVFTYDSDTLRLVDPATGETGKTVAVPGEGVWKLDVPEEGMLRFEPESGVHADATPIGLSVEAINTVGSGYVTVASPAGPTFVIPPSIDNVPGATITIPKGAFAASPLFNDVTEWRITGQDEPGPYTTSDGTWEFLGTRDLRFVPSPDLIGDPDPLNVYLRQLNRPQGRSDATVTITYAQAWVTPGSTNNVVGSNVVVDPLADDDGTLDPTSVRIINPYSNQPTTSLSIHADGDWTVNPTTGIVTFDPRFGATHNPTPITVSAYDQTAGDPQLHYSIVAVDYGNLTDLPVRANLPPGDTITVDPLVNGVGILDPRSVNVIDPSDNQPVTSLTVAGEGTWTVETVAGLISFAPLAGFDASPTPVAYTVENIQDGFTHSGIVTLDYATRLPTLSSVDNVPVTTVTIDPLASDNGTLDPSSIQFIDAWPLYNYPRKSMTVRDEGTWTADSTTGLITFAPEPGFTDDPTPLDYTVDNTSDGQANYARVIIDYSDLLDTVSTELQRPRIAASANPLAGDDGTLDPTSIRLIDPANGERHTTVEVAGQGTWTVDPTTGLITIDPQPDLSWYWVMPSINYEVDAIGCADPIDCPTSVGTVNIRYARQESDKSRLMINRRPGEVKYTNVSWLLSNNRIDPDTFRFVSPTSGELVREVAVDGEGVWKSGIVNRVDPDSPKLLETAPDDALLLSFEPEQGVHADATPVDYFARQGADSVPFYSAIESTAVTVLDIPPSIDNVPGTIVVIPRAVFEAAHPDDTFRYAELWDEDCLQCGFTTPTGFWHFFGGDLYFYPAPEATVDPEPAHVVSGEWHETYNYMLTSVSYAPVWATPASTKNPPDTAVTIDPLANEADLDPTTVRFYDHGSGTRVATLTVPGEGTWTSDSTTGETSFTPETDFTGQSTPVTLSAYDQSSGDPQIYYSTASVELAAALDTDASVNNVPGAPVTLDPHARSRHLQDPASVEFVSPASNERVATLGVSGEGTWAADPVTGFITFTPEPGFTSNPTPVDFTIDNQNNDDANYGTATVRYANLWDAPPIAGATPGTSVTIDPFAGDNGTLDPTTLRLHDNVSGTFVRTLNVPGEGSWIVNTASGLITFKPEPGIVGDPTPITTKVDSFTGTINYATATIYYASPRDTPGVTNAAPGTTVIVDPLQGDNGTLDPTTVELIDPSNRESVRLLVTPGEGTWTVNPSTGLITFTPTAAFTTFTTASGFTNDPTPITYRVNNLDNNGAGYSTVTIDYANIVNTASSGPHIPGTAATIDPLNADRGALDPTSVKLVDPATDVPVTSLAVPGEGTWSVNPNTGVITFTPETNFTNDPTPIDFTINNLNNDDINHSTATIDYANPLHTPTVSATTPGTTVTIDPLQNDNGTLDPTTVKLINPATDFPATTLTIPGQGTWTVNPNTGVITFTPETNFTNDPTPINFTINNLNNDEINHSTATINYPNTNNDPTNTNPPTRSSSPRKPGQFIEIDPLHNDQGNWDPTSLRLIDTNNNPTQTINTTNVGTWLINTTTNTITFAPDQAFTDPTTSITYEVDTTNCATDPNCQTGRATITANYWPTFTTPTITGITPGTTTTIKPNHYNPNQNLDPTTISFDTPNGTLEPTVNIPGQGTWTTNPNNGNITFTPEPGFTTNPTPIGFTAFTTPDYELHYSTLTIIYTTPRQTPPTTNPAPGTTTTINPTANDNTLNPTSTQLLNPQTGQPTSTLTIAGEGIWTINPDTGDITFTPEPGFTTNPTPIDYTIDNHTKTTSYHSTAIINYPQPTTNNDSTNTNNDTTDTDDNTTTTNDDSTNNDTSNTGDSTASGPFTINPLQNDDGSLDPTSVRLIDPASGQGVLSLTIAGEGTWTVNPDTGLITFTPEPGFNGNPTPISYTISAKDSDTVIPLGATVTRTPTGQLAFTGTATPSLVKLALLLTLLGAALTALTRRRTPPANPPNPTWGPANPPRIRHERLRLAAPADAADRVAATRRRGTIQIRCQGRTRSPPQRRLANMSPATQPKPRSVPRTSVDTSRPPTLMRSRRRCVTEVPGLPRSLHELARPPTRHTVDLKWSPQRRVANETAPGRTTLSPELPRP